MKLNVAERLNLLGILPAQGDFVTLKIVRKLREALTFDEAELAVLNVKQDGDRVTWNPEADSNKDVEIGEKATDIVVASLKKLNDEKKLTNQHYSLYEKFIGDQNY